MLKRKYLSRRDWSRITRRAAAFAPLSQGSLCGAASLLHTIEVTAPLVKTYPGHPPITIVEAGGYWLQVAPRGENWWLTAMFDRDRNTLQYYFDITAHNHIDGENSYMEDLFLDVVVLPDGSAVLLDEDELAGALAAGVVSRSDGELAKRVALEIQSSMPRDLERLQNFCLQAFETLAKKL